MKKEGSKRARNFLFRGRNNLGGSRLATDASASIFNLCPRNIPTKHFYHLQSQLFLSLAVQISPLHAPSSLFSCYLLSSLISFVLSIVSKDAGILGNFKRNILSIYRQWNAQPTLESDVIWIFMSIRNIKFFFLIMRSCNILYRRFPSTTLVFPKREFSKTLLVCGFLWIHEDAKMHRKYTVATVCKKVSVHRCIYVLVNYFRSQ